MPKKARKPKIKYLGLMTMVSGDEVEVTLLQDLNTVDLEEKEARALNEWLGRYLAWIESKKKKPNMGPLSRDYGPMI